MFKKVKDLTFSLVLIFVITIGIYWLMVELQKDYLDHYLSLLGDKLIELVPESSEKRSLIAFFDDFKLQVENQEVTPEEVEKVAAGILNISTLKDSITADEARAVLDMAEMRAAKSGAENNARIMVRPQRPDSRNIEVRWRELGEKLESIYKLDQQIRNIPDSVKLDYRFDNNLTIIVDDRAKDLLKRDEYKQMAKELRRLEEEKALIWEENVANQMREIRIRLRELRAKNKEAAANALEKIIVINPDFNIDSLSQVMVEINMDSINVMVERELERELHKEQVH